jgi:hypothetical protein
MGVKLTSRASLLPTPWGSLPRMVTIGEACGRAPNVQPQSVSTNSTVQLEHRRAIAQRVPELRSRLGCTLGDLAARAERTPEAVRALEQDVPTPNTWTIKLLTFGGQYGLAGRERWLNIRSPVQLSRWFKKAPFGRLPAPVDHL